jgi:hypothetical protein
MITDDNFPWWCAFASGVLKHFFMLLIAMDRKRYSSNCSGTGHEAIWGTVCHISSLMLVGGEWMVSFRFRSPFSSGKEPRLLNEDEALGAPEIVWTFRRTEKSLFFSGNRNTIPRTSIPYGLINSEQMQIPIKLEYFGFHCLVDKYRCLLRRDEISIGNQPTFRRNLCLHI